MKKGTIEGAVPLVAWAVPDARNGTARIIVAAMRTAAARGTRSLILGSAAYDPCSFGKNHFAVSGSATTARTAGLISRQRSPRVARRTRRARSPDGRPEEGPAPRGRARRSSRTRRATSRAALASCGRHFVEEREPLADERGQILRLTRRHEAAVDADDRHLVAGLPERVVGLAEFGVLEAVGKHTRDLHGCSPLLRPAAVVRPTAVPVRSRQCAARAGP